MFFCYNLMNNKIFTKKDLLIKERQILACLMIIAITIAVYWQVNNFEFISFDDNLYVTENPHVQSGLTVESLKWAFNFSDKESTYWHPLTWLSHMLDCQLFGLQSGRHHRTNLFLHVLNSLLLFIFLNRSTREFWKAFFVAALFAVHPLNVETVAWIAERKNLLSTFFWLLTLLFYKSYVDHPSVHRYLSALFIFIIGLLAKPTIITLPCVLLLLDYWPFKRIESNFGLETTIDRNRKIRKIHSYDNIYSNPKFMDSIIPNSINPYFSRLLWLLLEKVPFFLFSLISVYISILSLQNIKNIVSEETMPFYFRIANALVSYAGYIRKILFPSDLSFYYPYPDSLPVWGCLISGLVIILVTFFLIKAAKASFYPGIVGWLWYIGTLVPVIGLVQGGRWPAMADRWVYIPIIGIFIITAWGVPVVAKKIRVNQIYLCMLFSIILLIFVLMSFLQLQHWKNNINLYSHALSVNDKNYVAHSNMGNVLSKLGRFDEAMEHYLSASKYMSKSDMHDVLYNIGVVLFKQGRYKEAADLFSKTIQIMPANAEAENNLGATFEKQGKLDDAIRHYKQALVIKPAYPDAHFNIGAAYFRKGMKEAAFLHFIEALNIEPNHANTINFLKEYMPDQYNKVKLRNNPKVYVQ